MRLLASILKSAALRKLLKNIEKAQAGDPRAQYKVGITYARGNGVPQNDAEAAKWYLKAAEQGNNDAQLRLGFLLEEGQGVEQDLPEAYKWIVLDTRGGSFEGLFGLLVNDAARQHRRRLKALMTPEQIAEGEKRLNPYDVEFRRLLDEHCRKNC